MDRSVFSRTILILFAGIGFQMWGEEDDRGPLSPAAIDDQVLVSAKDYPGDWLNHGLDYAETRYSPLDQINAENVDRLGLAWSLELGTKRGIEATPIVVDGIMYASGTWSDVFAIDARDGTMLWHWDAEVPREYVDKTCCDVVNRGVALYRGKVFVGTLDGRIAAIDAGTGETVWETLTVDPEDFHTITGAPRIVKGKVIIGNGGAEFGVRGYVSAYNAETGEMEWRTYTVPGNPALPFESEAMEMAAATWNGEWWKYGGGGTAWDSFAYDPVLNLLYVGTGNGSPWNRHIRSPGGGDNLFLASILALNPDNGEYVWHYQTTPGESWDFTATQHMILADLELNGELRQVIMQAPKNGFFFVLDRKTGEFLSGEPYVEVTWATGIDQETGRPIEAPGADYKDGPMTISPVVWGGHNWHPMSYNPNTGLVYIPATLRTGTYEQDENFVRRTDGPYNFGANCQWDGSIDRAPARLGSDPTEGSLESASCDRLEWGHHDDGGQSGISGHGRRSIHGIRCRHGGTPLGNVYGNGNYRNPGYLPRRWRPTRDCPGGLGRRLRIDLKSGRRGGQLPAGGSSVYFQTGWVSALAGVCRRGQTDTGCNGAATSFTGVGGSGGGDLQ